MLFTNLRDPEIHNSLLQISHLLKGVDFQTIHTNQHGTGGIRVNIEQFYEILLNRNQNVNSTQKTETIYPKGKRINLIQFESKKHTHTIIGCTHVTTYLDY